LAIPGKAGKRATGSGALRDFNEVANTGRMVWLLPDEAG
jgi:hypothetical protein